MSSLSSSTTANQAIIMTSDGGPRAAIRPVSVPTLRDDYMLVRVKAVALNPTDWKHVDFASSPGARVGCDYAGVVEEVGKSVVKGFKRGDRVAGFVHGCNKVNHEDGAFGNLITAKGDIQILIPAALSFEQASTLGIGITTIGQTLYQTLKLPLPNDPTAIAAFQARHGSTSSTSTGGGGGPLILIYGGSTATGALAIQFAALSGCTVLTTSSPQHSAHLKGLGATAVIDYRSPASCVTEIRALTHGRLTRVLDCISDESSARICLAALSSSSPPRTEEEGGGGGGTYSVLLDVDDALVREINPGVKKVLTLAYTVAGEAFEFFGGRHVPASEEDFEFGKRWWEVARGLLAEGKVVVHEVSVNEGGVPGLEGVLGGLELIRQGRVSGRKLVYTL